MPGPGRKKGGTNKFTRTVQQVFEACFDGIGGLQFMVAWAKENPTEFFRIYGKQLRPLEGNENSAGITIIVQRVEEPRAAEKLVSVQRLDG